MIDWTPIVGGVAVLVNAIVIPWAISAYQKRTGVQITDQQRAAVYSAMDTAKGILQTQLDQGKIKVSDIHPNSPVVVEAAQAALDRVPDSAKAQGMELQAAAQIVASRVDTSPKPVVVVPAVVASQGTPP